MGEGGERGGAISPKLEMLRKWNLGLGGRTLEMWHLREMQGRGGGFVSVGLVHPRSLLIGGVEGEMVELDWWWDCLRIC